MNSDMLKKVGVTFVSQVQTGNWSSVRRILTKAVSKFVNILFLPVGIFLVLIIRAIRPWYLVRFNILTSERMGHFAGNTELYLCERAAGINTPKIPYVDLWYHNWPICNKQLARMWGRVLHIAPGWLLAPVSRLNSFFPGGKAHQIKISTIDRDVHNLLDRFPPHLSFLPEEEKKGQAGLRALGVPEGARFVCLHVRDDGYLRKTLPWRDWSYHDYRNCNIQNYIHAAQELANRGYYVIRVGAVVKEAMNVNHPMIIDYSTNGMRSDFMDIYLGAKCEFCISNGSGFDAVPYIFRRPIVYVDHVPLGIINTYSSRFLVTTKKHWLRREGRFMTFHEIFESGAGNYNFPYAKAGIDLIENSPEDIAAAVLEMEARARGAWRATDEDEELQRRFWNIFPRNELHGEIRSRIGADFLRKNRNWLG